MFVILYYTFSQLIVCNAFFFYLFFPFQLLLSLGNGFKDVETILSFVNIVNVIVKICTITEQLTVLLNKTHISGQNGGLFVPSSSDGLAK